MEDIRLIIWDMDETFWNGTLTEGEIEIPDAHKELIPEIDNESKEEFLIQSFFFIYLDIEAPVKA